MLGAKTKSWLRSTKKPNNEINAQQLFLEAFMFQALEQKHITAHR